MKELKIGIITGDLRQTYLAKLMKEQGFAVTEVSRIQDMPAQVTDIFFPIPATKIDTIKETVDNCLLLESLERIYATGMPTDCIKMLKEKQIEVTDLLADEKVAKKNAHATAEGTLARLITMMPGNVDRSKIAVLGFGNCGKEIAKRIYCMGANVNVVARREESRNLAMRYGFCVHTFLDYEFYKDVDAIINTVPALVVTRQVIDILPTDAVVIDIASAPGGCDFAYLEEKGICYELALGLPGKYSPKDSAKILLEAFMMRS